MSNTIHTYEYEVTADGRVLSVSSNWRGYGQREMRPTLNSHGYKQVRLMVNGKRKAIPVHRLVAEKFLGKKPSAAHEVCHINGDKLDNRAENLRWGTRAENAADREKHGRTSRGEKHSAAIRASNQANGARAYRARQRAAVSTLEIK